jgi:hypothetical protein
MFITFRDTRTQTFVFNIDAYRILYNMALKGYNHIDMEVTDTQVLFKFNNEGKGCHLYKAYRSSNRGSIRKAIHAPEWVKPLTMAFVPFGRLYVRFDEANKMFIYENVDKQFSREFQAVKNEGIISTSNKACIVSGNTINTKRLVKQIVDDVNNMIDEGKQEQAIGVGTVGMQDAQKIQLASVYGGSKRTINRAMRRKMAKQKRLNEKRVSKNGQKNPKI